MQSWRPRDPGVQANKRWVSDVRGKGVMFGLGRKLRYVRESFTAGATNTGNVTATADDKLVLNWHCRDWTRKHRTFSIGLN